MNRPQGVLSGVLIWVGCALGALAALYLLAWVLQ